MLKNVIVLPGRKRTELRNFPAASNSPGVPGDTAVSVIDGTPYIAVYTGNGTTHSWVFTSASSTHPGT